MLLGGGTDAGGFMTVRERVLKRSEELDETQPLKLEHELATLTKPSLSVEELARRGPLFGGRTLDLARD